MTRCRVGIAPTGNRRLLTVHNILTTRHLPNDVTPYRITRTEFLRGTSIAAEMLGSRQRSECLAGAFGSAFGASLGVNASRVMEKCDGAPGLRGNHNLLDPPQAGRPGRGTRISASSVPVHGKRVKISLAMPGEAAEPPTGLRQIVTWVSKVPER